MKNFIVYSEEVKEAIYTQKPVVAFESTIITFGLPYPDNLKVAAEVENIARKNKAVPATIAIINGKIKVGLSQKDLEFLADPANKKKIEKVSRHNYPIVLGQKKNGATTVAGTMMACAAAGIGIFVTGGIGGVHKGAPESFDISADLREFEKSKVAVVSSGVKSILDIKLTLEYLETSGVPIIGFDTDDFPAFYSRKSGFKVPNNIKKIKELANVVDCSFKFCNSGILIANPIPLKSELNSMKISKLVDEILMNAAPEDIAGPKYTPYILNNLHSISKGKTLAANIALIKSNAEVGSKLAAELSKLN